MAPKILATSDFHGYLPEIPDCDVLLIGGDVCPDVDVDGTIYVPHMGKRPRNIGEGHWAPAQRLWLDTVFAPWLQALADRDIDVVGIAGNHDFAFQEYVDYGHELPWTYLEDDWQRVQGIDIWGSPWTPRNTAWAFHMSDERIREAQALCPSTTEILLVHGPPFKHCDFTQPYFGSEHAGFMDTADLLDRVEPSAYVCGHIHESYGWSRWRTTLVLNVSQMDKDYKPTNPPVEVQLRPRKPYAANPTGMPSFSSVKAELLAVHLRSLGATPGI